MRGALSQAILANYAPFGLVKEIDAGFAAPNALGGRDAYSYDL